VGVVVGAVRRYGRRRSLIVAHVITGVALIVSPFVPHETGKSQLRRDVMRRRDATNERYVALANLTVNVGLI